MKRFIVSIALAAFALLVPGEPVRAGVIMPERSKWLDRVYVDLVGRTASDAEQKLLIGLNLQSAEARRKVVSRIVNGAEYHQRVATNLYQTLLGHGAPGDAVSLNFARNRQTLLSSEEFFQKSARSPMQYVKSVHGEIYGTDIHCDDGMLNFAIKLSESKGRAAVVQHFMSDQSRASMLAMRRLAGFLVAKSPGSDLMLNFASFLAQSRAAGSEEDAVAKFFSADGYFKQSGGA